MIRYFMWTAYPGGVTVCWYVQENPDDGSPLGRGLPRREMVGMRIVGEVDTERLRGIPFARINGADPADYPCWRTDIDVPPPPTFAQVEAAWEFAPLTHWPVLES